MAESLTLRETVNVAARELGLRADAARDETMQQQLFRIAAELGLS